MLDNIMPAIGMGMTDMGLGLKQRAYEFMLNEQNKLAGAEISAALGIPDFNENSNRCSRKSLPSVPRTKN